MQANKLIVPQNIISVAAQYLRKHHGSPKILVKITRNVGDTIHGIPILKHYRKKFPNAAIAFITGYPGIHEFNEDTTKVFGIPRNLDPQERLKLWPLIKNLEGIDYKIIPAIHPFGAVHKENTFSYPCIADQYLHNAGITDLKPLGGRRYIINISEDDKQWANDFVERKGLNPNRLVLLEHHSYSHPVAWRGHKWEELVKGTRQLRFVSVAGTHEGRIGGSIDGRGITWRQTVALANKARFVLGSGSGITMLAAGAENQPKIVELNVPESVSMKTCGYAPSTVLSNTTPAEVQRFLVNQL